MKCTETEWINCNVERMGCEGCYYNQNCKKKEKNDEQEISKCAKNQGNKAD